MEWAKINLKVDFRKDVYSDAMWAYVIMSNDDLYRKAVVPKLKKVTAVHKMEFRAPKLPVADDRVELWKKAVNHSVDKKTVAPLSRTIASQYQLYC